MIVVNSLIEWLPNKDKDNPIVERVLHIDHSSDFVVLIDRNRDNKTALPRFELLSTIEDALQRGQARVVSDPVPVTHPITDRHNLPDKKLKKLERHEAQVEFRWRVIQYLQKTYGVDLFLSSTRGRACKDAAQHFGIKQSKTILKFLRWFWQDGQTINALRSHYGVQISNKPRNVTRKLGRPSKYSELTGHQRGKNLTEDDKENIRQAIKLIIIKPGENKPRSFFKDTHSYLLQNYYSDGIEIVDGNISVKLKPLDQRPTRNQVRDLYYREFDFLERIAHRYGRSAPLLNHGASKHDSTRMAFSSGSQYQIDATVGDIYLVSSIDPTRIIGRPVIYLVSDTFSRLIVGYSVTLEGPSWLGATFALLNIIEDKVEHCRQFGINIQSHLWPVKHMASTLLCDRGEFEGYNANRLLENWGIQDLMVLPPFRPDMKGIVESTFQLMNMKLVKWLPGAVYKTRERGVPDYRLDAQLTLDQFRRMMIQFILRHNNTRRMKNYELLPAMMSDGIQPYPLEIWNWGLKRAGRLIELDYQSARLGILPRKRAKVTRYGIEVDGLFYTSETVENAFWSERARKNRWSVEVIYDPRSTDEVYLLFENKRPPERCYLTPRHQHYSGITHWEALDRLRAQAQSHILAEEKDLQTEVDDAAWMRHQIGQIPSPDGKKLSKSQRLSEIRTNRAEERRSDAKTQIQKLDSQDSEPESQNVSNTASDTSKQAYGEQPNDLDMLRALQKKGKRNG